MPDSIFLCHIRLSSFISILTSDLSIPFLRPRIVLILKRNFTSPFPEPFPLPLKTSRRSFPKCHYRPVAVPLCGVLAGLKVTAKPLSQWSLLTGRRSVPFDTGHSLSVTIEEHLATSVRLGHISPPPYRPRYRYPR